MTRGMQTKALFFFCPLVALAACSGPKDGSSGTTTPNGAPTIATLDGRSGTEEEWTLEEGGPTKFLYFMNPQLKLSATCRKPDGALDCEAYRFLKSGMPVELARRRLDGRASAGTLACVKMGNILVHGKNALGTEDGFCKFRDGSMTTTGAIEQYSIRVLE
jgi:putative hemolysin